MALTNKLRGLIQHYGLGESVRLLGNRADIPELLAISDVFVFPSLYEAQPVALLEAMAAGLPIVASAIPAIQQIARHDKEALLVPPGDAMRLADAIIKLVTEKEYSLALAYAARMRVQKEYSIASTIEAYENLYKKLYIWGGE